MSQTPGEPQSSSESGRPGESHEEVDAGSGSTRKDPSPKDDSGDPNATTTDSPSGSGSEASPPERPAWWQGSPPPAGTQPPPPYQRQGPPPPPWQQAPGPWGQPQRFQQGPPGPTGPTGPAGQAPAERDRLFPHLIWEGVLALVTVVLMVATATTTSDRSLTIALDQAGCLGLLATGLAFSMRTGTPNLAVGSILYFSSTLSAYLITEDGWSKPVAFLVAIMISTLMGLVLGFFVAVLSVPSWAATLGAVAVIEAIVLAISRNPFISVRFDGEYPTALWYGLFFVLSAGGGALWLMPGLRRRLSAVREPGDPARWLGLRAGMGAIVGLTGSSFLAGLAAVPLLMRVHTNEGATTIQFAFAFAAVLFGGVSVFGRRAGVLGTFLAVTILALVQVLAVDNEVPVWSVTLVAGLMALVGAGVSRAVEGVNGVLDRKRPASLPPPPPLLPPTMAPHPGP